MARPSRRGNRSVENRKRRQRERKKSHLGRRPTIAELAKKEKVITPTKPPPIKGVSFKPKAPRGLIRQIKPSRPTVKPRRPSIAQAREILIVSRKGQPQIFTQVEPLERRNYPPTSISSSWLSTYGYFFNEKIGTFTTKTGRQYKILNFDFDTWEKWYYSHSKGTFWNDFIRDQYTIVGTL